MSPTGFLSGRVRDWAKLHPQKIALMDGTGNHLNYADLHRLSNEFLEFLRPHRRGPILVLLPEGVKAASCIASLLMHGQPGMAISAKTPSFEVERILARFPFAGILTTSKILNREGVPCPLLGPDGIFVCLPERKEEATPFAWLLLTSGSTGSPKAVMLSEQNLRERSYGEIKLFELDAHARILCILSVTHDLGLNQLLCALQLGATLDIRPALMLGDFYAALDANIYTAVTGTPMVWSLLLQHLKTRLPRSGFTGLFTISGGSMTTAELTRLRAIFPLAKIIKTYGQTETFRTLAEFRAGYFSENSCGLPLPGVTARILNEQLEPCALGEMGQMVHFGAGTMTGYWNDTELSALKMLRLQGEVGVLTGDYFTLLPEGGLRFIGRRDDLVKRMDHRISLSEVEALLHSSGLINEVCVVALPGKTRWGGEGQRLVAFFTASDPRAAETLAAFCTGRLAPHHLPDEFRLVARFPLTASAKPDRQRLLRENEVST